MPNPATYTHVYVARFDDGQHKVGASSRVEARLKELGSLTHPVVPIRVWNLPSIAGEVERKARKLLALWRTGSRYDFFRSTEEKTLAMVERAILVVTARKSRQFIYSRYTKRQLKRLRKSK